MSEEWGFYFRRAEDNIASLFVDLGIHASAPVPGLTELAWLNVDMREPRSDGLSSASEFPQLCEIEDGLENATAADPKIAYVGRNTSDGRRSFYFYCAHGDSAQRCLSSAMRGFSEYRFETGSRVDPRWSEYFQFLYPSEREYQMILNERVLTTLEENGDKHELERAVSHWAYFGSRYDRSRFLSVTSERGYRAVGEHEDEDGSHPFGVTIDRVNAVDLQTINKVVWELFDLAKECNGNYDGWETPVQKEAPHARASTPEGL